MRPKARVSWIVVAASTLIVLLGPPRGIAADEPFDFRVDRFELERSGLPVSPKFHNPFVEEFDADLRSWLRQYGTASIADGFLHLTNPGTPLPDGLGVLPGRTLYLSLVASSEQVFDGEGDFVARSWWQPDELVPGDFNHLSLNTLGLAPNEIAGLAITNSTPEGEPTVYTIVQHLVRLGSAPELASVDVAPGAITGQLVFEVRFDDDTNALTTAFSLDGGVTFQQPFPPMRVFQGTFYGVFLLGADPLVGTVRAHAPAPPLCTDGDPIVDATMATTTKAHATVAFRGKLDVPLADYDPKRLGAQVRIVDRAVLDVPILDLAGTASLPRSGGCGPRDGWHRVQGGFVYKNATDALPPACAPGSAQGLTRLRLKSGRVRTRGRRGHPGVAYEIDVATDWRPVPTARVAATIVLGGDASVSASCGTAEITSASQRGR